MTESTGETQSVESASLFVDGAQPYPSPDKSPRKVSDVRETSRGGNPAPVKVASPWRRDGLLFREKYLEEA